MGDSSEARAWILQINGSCGAIPFEHHLKLQVYSTLRQRGEKRLKRKLEQGPIKKECLGGSDEEAEAVKRELQAIIERKMFWEFDNLPLEFLKYKLQLAKGNINF